MEKVIVKRENIADYLFDYQLKIIGATRMSIIDDDRWRSHFTMTRVQYGIFRDYAVALMMKTFRCNKTKARSIFEWYWEMFGVRLKGSQYDKH